MLLRQALITDLEHILVLARAFDLDVESANHTQFLVAVREGVICGFGRLILREGFAELATLGVVASEQRKGIGKALVAALSARAGDQPLYLVTVLPDYFARLGFERVQVHDPVLRHKIDYCISFGFTEPEVKVMRYLRA